MKPYVLLAAGVLLLSGGCAVYTDSDPSVNQYSPYGYNSSLYSSGYYNHYGRGPYYSPYRPYPYPNLFLNFGDRSHRDHRGFHRHKGFRDQNGFSGHKSLRDHKSYRDHKNYRDHKGSRDHRGRGGRR